MPDYYTSTCCILFICLLFIWVYACIPVCWLSRISSERTPVSFGCPLLKEGQHSKMYCWDMGMSSMLTCKATAICITTDIIPLARSRLIHSVKVHLLLTLTEGTYPVSLHQTPASHMGHLIYLEAWMYVCVFILYFLHTCPQMTQNTLKKQFHMRLKQDFSFCDIHPISQSAFLMLSQQPFLELVYRATLTSISTIPASPAHIWPEFLASNI